MKTLKRVAVIAASLLFAVPYEAVPALTRVGAAGGVSGQVLAMAPEAGEGVQAGVGRIISSGKTIYHNDKIATDAKGRLQVMLLDETVFTIGPNSEMYIDEFVYDPKDASKNKVTARVAKGVFRFVTGNVARKDPDAMKVKLPVGTIGIRGTIAGGSVQEGETLIALLGPGSNNNAGEKPGAVDVATQGGQVTISAPGFATTITGGGEAPPTPPAQLTPQQQQQLSTEPPPPPPGTGSGGSGGQTASTSQTGEGQAQDSGGGAGGESATQAAAADSAATQSMGTDTNSIFQNTQLLTQETTKAAQESAQAILDGIAQWADVMTVPTGSGYFSGSGDYSCSGSCLVGGSPAGNTGTASFMVSVDFGAKTIGGGPSDDIQLSGAGAGGGQGFDTACIPQTSFSGLSGPATVSLNGALTSMSGKLDGTAISLINQGGVAAHHAQLDLHVDYGSGSTVITTPTPIPSGPLIVPPPQCGSGGPC